MIEVIFLVHAFLIGIMLATIPGYWFKKRINIDGKEILISNNLLGVEKVYVNGAVVISKFAWAGTHQFQIENIEYVVSFFFKPHFLSVGVELRRGNEILYSDR
jgi:hypothetical protein